MKQEIFSEHENSFQETLFSLFCTNAFQLLTFLMNSDFPEEKTNK